MSTRTCVCLVWFLCLIAYQLSWVIKCQNHPSRRTAVVLLNPWLREDKGVIYLSQGYLSESERKRAAGVRTRLLQFRSQAL